MNPVERFDEAFVAGARFREPPAPEPVPARRLIPPPPPRRRGAGPRVRAALARVRAGAGAPWLVLVGIAVVLSAVQVPPAAPDHSLGWAAGAPPQLAGVRDRPPPERAASRVPLGLPQPAPPGGGSHAFLATQPGSDEPVAYDPCRPLRYVVNPRTAPPGGEAILLEAIAEIAGVTGLRFEAEGATDEAPVEQRPPFQPDRYGDRWAPILIAWSDPAELPGLTGITAGLGGSVPSAASRWDDTVVFVSGIVLLDGPQLAEMLAHPDGAAHARSVILHELGHLVGLAHVEDPGALMHSWANQTELQAGDLAGLTALGSGPCVRTL